MKKILALMMFVLLISNVSWGYGIVNNSGSAGADSITFPFFALDSAGNVVDLASGDSIFIQVHTPEGAMAFEDSGSYNGTGLAGALTLNDFSGATMYYYSDAVADIDGSPSQGVYTYCIITKDLTGADIQTPTCGSFQLVTETDFNLTLEYILDILDTLRNQDDWASHQTTVDSILDSTNANYLRPTTGNRTLDVASTGEVGVDFDNIKGGLGATEIDADAIGASELASTAAAEISDSTWNKELTGATFNRATSSGRRLRIVEAAFVLDVGTAQVSGGPGDAGTYIILAAATSESDDFFNHAVVTIDGGTGVGQARAVFDYTGANDSVALHTGDDWITDPDATSTYVISAGSPVEVIHLHAEAIDDISGGVWDATKDATLKSLVISNSGGDALRLVSTGSNGDGAHFIGFGTGSGIRANGGASGHGGYFIGGATAGHGISAEAGTGSAKDGIRAQGDGVGEGLSVKGGTNGNGFQAQGGVSSGDGFYALGTGTGNGINAVSGSGATGDGIKATAASTNGNGIKLTATGTGVEITGDDLVDLIWNEDSTGHWASPQMAWVSGQTGASATDTTNIKAMLVNNWTSASSGLGWAYMIADSIWDATRDATLKSLVVSNNAGDAVQFTSTGGNGDGFQITGVGTGNGILAQSGAGATGNGVLFKAISANGNGMKLMATGTGVEITGDDLVDLIWNEDSTGHYTDPHMAFLASQTGASSGISDADMIAIADTVWNRDSTGHYTSPHMAFLASQTGASGGVSNADMGSIADSVWQRDTSISTASSYGVLLKDTLVYRWGGYGPSTLVIWAVDTSGTDDTVSFTDIGLDNLTGSDYATQSTKSIGNASFNYTPTVTFNVAAQAPGYFFDDTSYIFTGTDTVAILGYNIDVGTAGGGASAQVYTYIYDIEDNPIEDAIFKLTLSSASARDTCSDALFIKRTVTVYSDNTGLAAATVLINECFTSPTNYKWEVRVPRSNMKRTGNIVIPVDSVAGGYRIQ